MTTSIDFGVQSYCFRETTDNAILAAKVRAIGLDKVELCDMHGDFSDPKGFQSVVDIYRSAGVSIVSLGVLTFVGAKEERAWFESAAAAGARHISCHFKVDSFMTAIPKVRSWAREFGIRVGVHCHGGLLFGGSPDVVEYLLSLGGPEIGLCIDSAWVMQIGPPKGNPVDWVKKFSGRITGVHFKDFVFDRDGMWNDVVVGTGALDLPAFATALTESGFDGMSVIEYEADAEAPEAALKECVDAMRASFGDATNH